MSEVPPPASSTVLPASNTISDDNNDDATANSATAVTVGGTTTTDTGSDSANSDPAPGVGTTTTTKRKDGRNYVQKNSLTEEALLKARDETRSSMKRKAKEQLTEQDKAEDRRAANRLSAFQSRQRRKMIIEDLQKTVSQQSKHIAEQSKEINDLKRLLQTARQENEVMRHELAANGVVVGGGAAAAGSGSAGGGTGGGQAVSSGTTGVFPTGASLFAAAGQMPTIGVTNPLQTMLGQTPMAFPQNQVFQNAMIQNALLLSAQAQAQQQQQQQAQGSSMNHNVTVVPPQQGTNGGAGLEGVRTEQLATGQGEQQSAPYNGHAHGQALTVQNHQAGPGAHPVVVPNHNRDTASQPTQIQQQPMQAAPPDVAVRNAR
jgi:hypothetical protein